MDLILWYHNSCFRWKTGATFFYLLVKKVKKKMVSHFFEPLLLFNFMLKK
jgi:hypothetical protein